MIYTCPSDRITKGWDIAQIQLVTGNKNRNFTCSFYPPNNYHATVAAIIWSMVEAYRHHPTIGPYPRIG